MAQVPNPSLFWVGLFLILTYTLPSNQAESFIHTAKLLRVRPTLGARDIRMNNVTILIQETGTQGKNSRLVPTVAGPGIENGPLISFRGQGWGRCLGN